jgi:sulfur-oxidizing protein SoxA
MSKNQQGDTMLLKVVQSTALIALSACVLHAGEFNAQAEKDRLAIIKYFEAKFEDPLKNRSTFFPYSTDDELKNSIAKGVKYHDFAKGNYAFNIDGKSQYEEIKEMPPYEDAVEAGEELFNRKFSNGNSFATCFKDPAIAAMYPFFDETRKEVITLTVAINECLTANGEKPWKMKKGNMATLQGYMAFAATEAEKRIDTKITSADAAAAYDRGKKYYYTQRGYLKLSCASCHVQGAGQRVRNEKLSQLLGQVTHFPVHRLKWGGLGTLERRMAGCIKDEGQVPPKEDSKEMRELLYFMAYMSNGMKIDGPDIRK